MTDLFEFNGDYNDLEQVAEFLPAFAELKERGLFYNDDFKGRIPGIGNTEKRGPNVGTHEEAAIYLLQGLYRQRAQDAKVAALLADGYRHVEHLDGVERFAHVVLYPTRRMGGPWAEFRDARLVPEDQPHQREVSGPVRAVLPKGRRKHGHLVLGRRVLVRP